MKIQITWQERTSGFRSVTRHYDLRWPKLMKTGPTPVDTRMEAIGGSVFRRSLSDVKQTIHEENVGVYSASK
jgi:hypothetical protein